MKKISLIPIVCAFFLTRLCCAEAPDPLTGVRISLLGIQTALSEPPIPDLHDTHKGSLAVAGSLIIANVSDTETSGGFSLVSNGSFLGGGVGLGYSSPTSNRIGYFVFATANYVSGNLQMNGNGVIINLANMKNEGFGTAAGGSLRLWKMKSLDFSGGIFVGPTFSYFSSKFNVQDQTGATVGGGTYTAQPTTLGAMGGAQIGFTLIGIYFNPYAIYYQDFSDGCRNFNTSIPLAADAPASQCSEGPYFIKLPLSYFVYGINVGIKSFFFTAYSHVNKDSSMNSINLNAYQASYRFDF